MEETTVSTVEQEQTSDSFMEGFDDADTYAVAADQPEEQVTETQQEDQHTESSGGDGEGAEQGADPASQAQEAAQQTEAEKVDAPKRWDLRHMGEVKSVDEAEMVTLAQKGMDYDRIRGKYDEAKPVMELFGQFAKQAGMSVTDYVAHIRMQAKQSEGMSEAEARRAVELEDREAVVSAREAEHQAQQQAAAGQTAEKERRMAEIEAFRKVYPDAAKDPKGIPAEVWESVRGGMNLVTAYAIYDAKQARAAQVAAEQKAAAADQNHNNASRSTGSMRSAGDNTRTRDPFEEGFDAG